MIDDPRWCSHHGRWKPCGACAKEAVERERDELAAYASEWKARAEKLHAALRQLSIIIGPNDDGWCDMCMAGYWDADTPERHAPGCLAAPEDNDASA